MAAAPSAPRGHWIDGSELLKGVAGGTHPMPGGEFRQLRAGVAEIEAAERALRAGGVTRRSLALERLDDWLEALLDQDDWLDEWALELRLPTSVLEPELDRLEALDLAALAPVPAPQPGQCALVLVHWSYGMADLVEFLASLWLAGWPLLLVGDGRLPGLVHRLGRVGAQHLGPRLAALPAVDPAALQATHWRSAVALGRLASQERLSALIRRGLQGGLLVPEGGPLLEVYRSGRWSVQGTGDPALAARAWLSACLSPYPALGGQAHRVPTWAEVPARAYARFCEAAWDLLEGGFGQPLCAPVEPGGLRGLALQVEAALEQGGVLISGPEGPGEVSWRPALFVNCEPGSDLLTRREPVPMLCLSRC
jgi:hypothetical protein